MNGHICPECGTGTGTGTERAAAASDDVDGRPGCRCAERAAEAVRAERSAEVAAAEDFHPLRIRPYVTLQSPETDSGAPLPPFAEGDGDGATTMALEVVKGPAYDDSTAPLPAVPSALPPVADTGYELDFGQEPPVPDRKQRKGPALWLAVGAATVAVVGTAAFAGGLFSGDDERDRALLPDMVTSAPSASDDPEASASQSGIVGSQSPTLSASESESASASASASASGSASSSSAAVSPSVGADSSEPVAATSSAAPDTTQATGTVKQSPEPATAATLSRGDRGAEVAELQERLAQAGLYNGPTNGQFNDRVEQAVRKYQAYKGIQGDTGGTYGPNTRRALEAETQEP